MADSEDWCTCEGCRQSFSLAAQRAYLRGRERFVEGQEHWAKTRDRRRRTCSRVMEQGALDLFGQAYSALQEAFRHDLAAGQRLAGIEMMAEITRLFVERTMVSGLEARYWAQLLVQQTAWLEVGAIDARLASGRLRGPLGWLWRCRWRVRRWQLAKALARLEGQLRQMEQLIGFVDPPHVRAATPRPNPCS